MTSMDQQPTSPGQRSRTFSFRSDKSGGSKQKVDLTESPKDKQRRDSIWKNTSKSNPNAAMFEDQPGVAALLEQATLQPLRDIEHKDLNGNPIVDPDLSNPTRPRLERPLDTIRSFEKAIDAGYKRRSSYRSDQQEQSHQSRRSSYAGGPDNGARYSQGGYYGGGRPDGYGPPRTRYGGNRMASDGGFYGGRPYQQHGYHPSQQTMNTDGSDSTGPWASNTDPSSENSSIDKLNALNKTDSGHGYPQHFDGPIMEEQGASSYNEGYNHRNGYGAPPVQPPNQNRRPIPLGGSSDGPVPPRASLPPTTRPEAEKKKGWLSRRFSKKA